jgi:hypothetical protein
MRALSDVEALVIMLGLMIFFAMFFLATALLWVDIAWRMA